MQIVGGVHKGRRLKTLKGKQTRPMLGRVREALFAILQPSIEGSRFVDLYAGSGAVGLEALSRGVAHCLFVERLARAVRVIRENIETLGVGETTRIIRADVKRFLKDSPEGSPLGDLVFLGPPYDTGEALATVRILTARELVDSGGLIIAQTSKREKMDMLCGTWRVTRCATYGDTALWFYSRSPG